ncbi:MAG: bifunctional YncE family protein/alkaline phosphatase family protein, partial [Deltaproteobacteria bacterium]|nr:bifunctional YncE family protein/alkaline phosphatase family protein [Deltaproteobacteria bacterium]
MLFRLRTRIAAALVAVSVSFHAPLVRALCQGDCNGDGLVTVDELIRAVGISLESAATPYRLCPPVDLNGDASVTVDEIIAAANIAASSCPLTTTVYRAPEEVLPAGPLGNGRGIMPNGRRIEPAGRQIATETLPLNLALTADGKYLLITNDGYGDERNHQYLQVLDTQTLQLTKTAAEQFYGVAVAPTGDSVFVAGDADAGRDPIQAFHLRDGVLTPDATVATFNDGTLPSGMALGPDGSHLFVAGLAANAFYSVDLATGTVHAADKKIGNLPFSVVVAPNGQRAYVSSWGINNGNPSTGLVPAPLPPLDPNQAESSSVAEIDVSDPDAPKLVRYGRIGRQTVRLDNKAIYGGTHPSAMLLSPDGKLLYVTATNVDVLSVLDTATMQTVVDVPLNVFESTTAGGDAIALKNQLQGFYPNALAQSADGRRLYIADAGINAVQVLDVDPSARSFTHRGFIPTGWYPTALALTADGHRLYVANGKGAAVGPNGGPEFEESGAESDYIGQLSKGSLSVIDNVDQFDWSGGEAAIVANDGFAPQTVRWVDGEPAEGEVERGQPVPVEYGSGPSDLIQHVVFIFKENRTYDQIFGTLPGGNGDPQLADWAGEPTPNHRALAEQFALSDNFYNDGEVSTLGHEWQDQANCSDFTEKMWPANYDRRLSSATLEQSEEGFTKGGFIFQALEKQAIPFRVYGETLGLLSRFGAGINGGGVGSLALVISQAFPGRLPTVDEIFTIVNGDVQSLAAKGIKIDILKNQVWPNQMLEYPSNILASRTDKERAELFKQELDAYSASGKWPSFIHIWLPNNHTFGSGAGDPTPRSAIADNDEGLGMIVDAITHSPFWPHTAIFVTEDDPQGGTDHVSAHRTYGMVISPYAKHGYIGHRH